MILLLAGICFLIGLFFQMVATIGLYRFSDVYSRQHVVCITDTLGAPLMLIGVCIACGSVFVSLKLILGLVFLFITSPLVSHMLARAALRSERQSAGASR